MYYFSRLLNSAERNYSTTNRECLAVIAVVKKFRVYVLGAPLEIRADHAAMRQLLNKVDATGRYARWVCIMSEFDFTLRYRPGPKHRNADGLSRAKVQEDMMSCGITSGKYWGVAAIPKGIAAMPPIAAILQQYLAMGIAAMLLQHCNCSCIAAVLLQYLVAAILPQYAVRIVAIRNASTHCRNIAAMTCCCNIAACLWPLQIT